MSALHACYNRIIRDLKFLVGRRGIFFSLFIDRMLSRAEQVFLPSFTTFAESALTLFRAMFGDFDFDEFWDVRWDEDVVGWITRHS